MLIRMYAAISVLWRRFNFNFFLQEIIEEEIIQPFPLIAG